jgi:DNA-binding cell septation regulator SpoVG
MDSPRQTVDVTATVLRLDRAEAGRLAALASVQIEIAGVAFVIHGVRIIRTGPRAHGIAAPCYRMATGRRADAISLPPELIHAIAEVVLDEFDALRGLRRFAS